MSSSSVSTLINVITSSPGLGGLIIAAVGVLLWRFYRFTITPLLYPNDPKDYPYWIPFIGHLRSFFKSSSELLTQSRLYFNDSREPYALTVAGQKWYILTHADDVTATYKITNGSLSYDIFVEEVMRMVNITEDGIRKAFQTRDPRATSSPAYKHLVALCKQYQLVQLTPGNQLDELLNPALRFISGRMKLEAIQTTSTHIAQSKKAVIVSLYHYISEIFIGFGQEAYFGKTLLEIEPDMVSIFMDFDALAWQVLYQYPSFLCGKMLAAKKKMQAALESYFSTPVETRSDAAWMILELEKDMKRLEIAKPDMAIFFFQLYWSVNGNIKKAPFWMLSYMLFRPALLSKVREEILPAFSSGKLNIEYLLNSCPLLNGVWDETTRLTAFAASVRFLTTDVVINNKILRKGHRIMMPQRQMHYNKSVFGSDAESFDANRFQNQPKLKRHASFRPFGGGTTLCPGRHLAKMTTLAFVAELVYRFELQLDNRDGKIQRFPEAAEGNPSIGLVDVMPGSDLRVNLSPRT